MRVRLLDRACPRGLTDAAASGTLFCRLRITSPLPPHAQGYNRHGYSAHGFDKVIKNTADDVLAARLLSTAIANLLACQRVPFKQLTSLCCLPCHLPLCLPSSQHGYDASGYNVEGKNAAGLFRFAGADKLVTSGNKNNNAKAGQ